MVVVGGGNAAMCAALAAQEQGARVVVLERAPREERGGNGAYTAGASAIERLKRDGLVMSCCNSKARGATAPRTSGCCHWNSCGAWPRWCRDRACI